MDLLSVELLIHPFFAIGSPLRRRTKVSKRAAIESWFSLITEEVQVNRSVVDFSLPLPSSNSQRFRRPLNPLQMSHWLQSLLLPLVLQACGWAAGRARQTVGQ